MLDSLKIVLVGTSHPGNIGSAARAMKTMGLTKLVLVSPVKFPHQHAIEMASGACDLLEEAEVVDTLEEAIADCHLVIGSSARPRGIQIPMLEMDQFGSKIVKQVDSVKSALVFGRERTGLNNDELGCCHFHVMVDTNPEYGSLNLAQAVQLFCYEIRKAYTTYNKNFSANNVDELNLLASSNEVDGFYQHLEQTLFQIEFLDNLQPKKVIPKLKRLFNRSHLESSEINILRGILSSMQKHIKD